MYFKQKTIIAAVVLFIALLTGCTPATPKPYAGLATPPANDPAISTNAIYSTPVESIWSSLENQFSLSDETSWNSAVRQQLDWYMSNREYLQRVTTASTPYLYYISKQVKMRGLPAEFTLLPLLESNYNPFACSNKGAVGLWQMMPGTASGYGVRMNWWYDGRRDIVASTTAALNYLQYLGDLFHHDWLLTLAAYNCGEGTVQRAINYNAKRGLPTDFWHLSLPKQTEEYVPSLLALATIVKHPYLYPADLPYIPNAPYLAQINIGSQIDLANAAKLACMSVQEISQLNPGFRRWATDPNGPYNLLIPVEKASKFQSALDHLPKSQRVSGIRYTVKKGDTLTTVARKFHSNAALLAQLNHLNRHHSLHAGQVLLIPSQKEKQAKQLLESNHKNFSAVQSNSSGAQMEEYQVRRGDTIQSISNKLHVKPKELKFWNGLKSDDGLVVGKTLVIWPKHSHSSQISRPAAKHKVRSGETLSSIAITYHVSVANLKNANHLKQNTIRKNQILIIPSKYHSTTKKHSAKSTNHRVIKYYVRSGDNLSTIAKKFGVSVNDLKRWNQLDTTEPLSTGVRLVIYK